jgi:hypothetical protein
MLNDWTYDNIMSWLQAQDSTLVLHKNADDSALRLNAFNVIPQVATSLRHFDYKNRMSCSATLHSTNP